MFFCPNIKAYVVPLKIQAFEVVVGNKKVPQMLVVCPCGRVHTK
jgi:hypothetical protein